MTEKLMHTHELTIAMLPSNHTRTYDCYICRESFFFFFCNAWLNCCKATENFIIQSWVKRRAGERKGRKRERWRASEAGRQQLWQQQAELKQGGGSQSEGAGQKTEKRRGWEGRGDGRVTARERLQHSSSSHQAGLQHLHPWGPQQPFKEPPSFNPCGKW